MEKPYTFAQRLQELINIKGITKSDLAKSCAIDKSNITRYLNGEYEARQDVIYRITSKYNVSSAWLMGYDVPMVMPDIRNKYIEPFDFEYAEKQDAFDELNILFSQLTLSEQISILAQLRGLVQSHKDQDAPKEFL